MISEKRYKNWLFELPSAVTKGPRPKTPAVKSHFGGQIAASVPSSAGLKNIVRLWPSSAVFCQRISRKQIMGLPSLHLSSTGKLQYTTEPSSTWWGKDHLWKWNSDKPLEKFFGHQQTYVLHLFWRALGNKFITGKVLRYSFLGTMWFLVY